MPEETSREFMFNTCPLCKDGGEKTFIHISKDAELSEPCNGCGTQFRRFVTPEQHKTAQGRI